MSISQITRNYIETLRLTTVTFAALLNERFERQRVGVDTVENWLAGCDEPDEPMLIRLAMRSRDWRFDFAIACLSVLDPSWVTGAGLAELVTTMRLESAALRDELIDERVLTAELVEQMEAEG